MSSAVRKYVEFHQFEPKRTGSFAASMVIPDEALCIGPAVNVLYRSDKLNPTTGEDEGVIDYIHEHDDGVLAYRTDRGAASADGAVRKVPAWIRNLDSLVKLGDCLGFAFEDPNGKTRNVKARKPLPELYTSPNGKVLLIVQSKRTLLTLIWGGRLGVEARGIVH